MLRSHPTAKWGKEISNERKENLQMLGDQLGVQFHQFIAKDVNLYLKFPVSLILNDIYSIGNIVIEK